MGYLRVSNTDGGMMIYADRATAMSMWPDGLVPYVQVSGNDKAVTITPGNGPARQWSVQKKSPDALYVRIPAATIPPYIPKFGSTAATATAQCISVSAPFAPPHARSVRPEPIAPIKAAPVSNVVAIKEAVDLLNAERDRGLVLGLDGGVLTATLRIA